MFSFLVSFFVLVLMGFISSLPQFAWD
uniref:Uncharacterized protein n=1 Tax=Arundo donax TaxID=35708 RepID=A0A0A9DFD4_ARUDO